MRYWLLRRPPQHYTDINSSFANQPYDYDKVFVNPKLHEGDVVYLFAAYNELYGWGFVVKKESYHDNQLNRRAYKLTITRPVLQQNLVPAEQATRHSELASVFLTDKNLIELNTLQANDLNRLLGSTGAITPPDKKRDDVPGLQLCGDFPKLEVPADQAVWLRAAYERVKEGKIVNPREMIIELWDQIPDFDYNSVDSRLMKFGVEPTLLGILQIDPTTEFCDLTDQVITYIKRKIQIQPNTTSATAEEVSEELEIDEWRVRLIFSFMLHLGKFWNGGGGDGNTPGYTTINIDYEEVKREYLRYEGLQPLLKRVAKVEQNQHSEPVDDHFVHSTLDWMLSEHLDDALSRISQLTSPDVIEYDTDSFAELVKQFVIIPPVLADEPLRDETMPELEDMMDDLKTGTTGHIVLLPIEGDGKWFQEINVQAVSGKSPLGFLDKARNWIYIKLTVSPDEREGILKQKLDERLILVRKYGDYITRRIVSFNSDLAERMSKYLNKRKHALERGRTEAQALGLQTTHNPRHAERKIQLERLTEILNSQFSTGLHTTNTTAETRLNEKEFKMSDLVQDALAIATYLYENRFVGSRSISAKELREATNLPDFDPADEYLLSSQISEGTAGGDEGQRWLTAKGVDYVQKSRTANGVAIATRGQATIDIFVSHSSKDARTAKALVSLLRAALNIPANRIRCTSVDGYRLRGGAHTDQQLRRELNGARVFVGLITRRSIQSTYVLFELGARWGAELPLVPVLVTSTDQDLLRGPLGGFNALACDSRSQIHQLVDDIAVHLGVISGSAASYQDFIEEVITSAAMSATEEVESAMPVAESINYESMSKHVVNYFDAKGLVKHLGFERIRKNINGTYSDNMLFEMIDRFPDLFRRVTLRGGKPAVGLVKNQSW